MEIVLVLLVLFAPLLLLSIGAGSDPHEEIEKDDYYWEQMRISEEYHKEAGDALDSTRQHVQRGRLQDPD